MNTTNNNIQLLNNNQIDGILEIIKRDIVCPQINSKIEEVLNSDEFKKLVEDISNREENLESINRIESEHEKNLKLKVLFDQIKEVDPNIFNDGYDFPMIVTASTEYINTNRKFDLEHLNDRIQRTAKYEIKINDSYSIIRNIMSDLTARLQLMTVSDFDTIIKEITQYINIDKYLYLSTKN
jgi:hypothetical protein